VCGKNVGLHLSRTIEHAAATRDGRGVAHAHRREVLRHELQPFVSRLRPTLRHLHPHLKLVHFRRALREREHQLRWRVLLLAVGLVEASSPRLNGALSHDQTRARGRCVDHDGLELVCGHRLVHQWIPLRRVSAGRARDVGVLHKLPLALGVVGRVREGRQPEEEASLRTRATQPCAQRREAKRGGVDGTRRTMCAAAVAI
jgi:hypothetical protein